LKLKGAICEGSGPVNEDGWGFCGTEDDVSAAWVFDGVTGINGRTFLGAESDAQWLVARAHDHLGRLASDDLPLADILAALVARLMADLADAMPGLALPADYDPPAACLILVKRYAQGWQALRLGDSCLLARQADGASHVAAVSPNNVFDNWLSREAAKRRDAGVLDIKALLAEFRPQLLEGRARRNLPGGYSILEASPAALAIPEYLDLGWPEAMMLCTDGYYRAVDHYGLHDDAGLLAASLGSGGVEQVLRRIRAIEAGDPDCRHYLRFKPTDDAAAVSLGR
jgi:hypothetical protein